MSSYSAPTWAHIAAFCDADEWEQIRDDTGHIFWQKVLADGSVLHTHRSLSPNKGIAPNLFGVILRDQLRVNREQFWHAVATGKPVDRPVELEDAPPQYEAWVISGLLKHGYTEAQVREMTPEEAKSMLMEKWSSSAS